MRKGRFCFACALFGAVGCGEGEREPLGTVDCSIEDAYEFKNIANFNTAEQSGWFRYADPTPGGVPDLLTVDEKGILPDSNVPFSNLEGSGRCGDTRFIKLEADGHNFWGVGYGDWEHNGLGLRADGTGFDGISFWARSAADAEKQFLLHIDEGRTMVLGEDARAKVDTDQDGVPDTLPGQDLDGDGVIGPGDIVNDTQCRLPPSEEVADVSCYNGGVDSAASGGNRVPEVDECGNAFHTRITTTEQWQLFFIPWKDLVQWPCPNRLEDGLNVADIAKFEIKLTQGMRYEIWLDNLSFYRAR